MSKTVLLNNTQIAEKTDKKTTAFIKISGRVTRNELMKISGMPRSTLYDSLVRLINKEVVAKTREIKRKIPGRPKEYYKWIKIKAYCCRCKIVMDLAEDLELENTFFSITLTIKNKKIVFPFCLDCIEKVDSKQEIDGYIKLRLAEIMKN